ncbi:hypothetical protein ACET3Z_003981 [Daucus carota]
MRQLVVQSLCVYLNLLIVFICLSGSCCNSLHSASPAILNGNEPLLPVTSPTTAPQPFLPLLAPSPLGPFTNSSVPKLSGQCLLDFGAAQSMMSDASIDCVATFAPYLANVVCCPQVEATLTVLIGQSSKLSKELALNGTSAKHCLSDFQQILVSQGANNSLQQICSIHASNLTEGSCPVKDVDEFESIVDTSNLISSCEKIDLVNECCEQVCQNAISEAAKKLALKAYDLVNIDGRHAVTDLSTRDGDCRNIVLRWLANKHNPPQAKKVLRGLSNCKINKVCPLVFPDVSPVTKGCHDGVSDQRACCNALAGYASRLQKQSFTTNLQALDCAATLGMKLQKENITKNVYELCHISLKDFSLQVGPKESGCLLPSMPSDVILDQYSGISFLCDLNDNIPAPWPSTSQLPAQSCNKTIKIPALPAAASGQRSIYSKDVEYFLLIVASVVLSLLTIIL